MMAHVDSTTGLYLAIEGLTKFHLVCDISI
jgi:hypothetical protein